MRNNTTIPLQEAFRLLEEDDLEIIDVEEGEQLEEGKLTEEAMVDIEDYLPKESYVESFNTGKINEEVEQHSQHYIDKLNKKINTYRKVCRMDESAEITEEHIDNHKWALNRTAMWCGTSPDKLKSELLGR